VTRPHRTAPAHGRDRFAGSLSGYLAPAALLALLALLATLQYRWTGQLGRAEEERARTSLNRAAAGVAADFDRELGRVFFFFLQGAGDDVEEGLARRTSAWRAQPGFPGLLRQLLLVEHDGSERGAGGGLALSALDEASGAWKAIEWPRELEPLREQLDVAGDEPGSWATSLPADVPALVMPVFPHGAGLMRRFSRDEAGPDDSRPDAARPDSARPVSARPEGELERRAAPFEPARPPRLAVLWLDLDTIRDRVLPALVDRHLGGEIEYHVDVRDAAGKLLFAQGPAVRAGEPDVAMPLFRLPLAERFARHHAERHGGMRLRVPGPSGAPRPQGPSPQGLSAKRDRCAGAGCSR
jgi:hypothetical protein